MSRNAHGTLRAVIATGLTAFAFVVAGRRTRRDGPGTRRRVLVPSVSIFEPDTAPGPNGDEIVSLASPVEPAPGPAPPSRSDHAPDPEADAAPDPDGPASTSECIAHGGPGEGFGSFSGVMERVDRVLESASRLLSTHPTDPGPARNAPIEVAAADNVGSVSVYLGEDAPSRDETPPREDAPVGREVPWEDAPVEQEAPRQDAPSGDEAPIDGLENVVDALYGVGLDDTTIGAFAERLRLGVAVEVALLEALAHLPEAPPLPHRAGSLLVVVGAAPEARRLAAALAGEIGTDPAAVPLASRHAGAHSLVSGPLLVRSAEEAAELAPGWRRSEPAVVVVEAPVAGAERSWASRLIAALRPTAVWGVVDATSKTEDVDAWIRAIGGVDALALENLRTTVSPAHVLQLGIPVARLEGLPASGARWVATIVDRIGLRAEPTVAPAVL